MKLVSMGKITLLMSTHKYQTVSYGGKLRWSC